MRRDLVGPVRPVVCPDCAGPIETVETTIDPLFLHGGYGEARREVVDVCSCSMFVRQIDSVRPRKKSPIPT